MRGNKLDNLLDLFFFIFSGFINASEKFPARDR